MLLFSTASDLREPSLSGICAAKNASGLVRRISFWNCYGHSVSNNTRLICEFGACGVGLFPQASTISRASPLGDLGATAAGKALNFLNWLIYTPSNREAPRRYFGSYWCGPGGAGPTGGVVNGACHAHDLCYENAKINADGNTNGNIYWSPGQVAAAKVCNQILYDAVKGSKESGAWSIQQWLLYGEGFILRPGTAAH